jgi:hypothetical protein
MRIALNSVFERYAGQPVTEGKAALRSAREEYFSPLDEETLTQFAELIAAGEYVEITTSGDEPAAPHDPPW